MKLRAKLFLSVGILLVCMVLVMYFVPSSLIRKDVESTSTRVNQLLIDEHKQLVKSQLVWLEEVMARSKENINATLYMIDQEQQDFPTAWAEAIHVIDYGPEIGMVQVHDQDKPETAVILPHATKLHQIKNVSYGKEVIAILLDPPEDAKAEEYIFVGVPLPEYEDLFALIRFEDLKEEKDMVGQEIQKALPALREHKEFSMGLSDEDPAYAWAVKIDLLQVLAPLFADGLTIAKNLMIPNGLARIDKQKKTQGVAILSREAFRTEPIFDDVAYFNSHAPKTKGPSIADGSVFVLGEDIDHLFLANTLRLQGRYLTVGEPVGPLAHQLALSSDKIILVRMGEKVWVGFDGAGNPLSQEELDKFASAKLLDQKEGVLHYQDQSYSFVRIFTENHEALVFYDLHPMKGQTTVLEALSLMKDKLSQKISLQLVLIASCTMILVLIFISRIALRIIGPITQLAEETDKVVAGHYDEVKLPPVGRRKDEVASLTRSFGNMVDGLRDREKIRSVLDKVVSKDVADEILKTTIHLGGEDRVASILFSDIRDFTQISSKFPPQKVIGMLNECMTKISRVIEAEGGVIDKYVGDEVMAIYGAPTTTPDHALRAVSAGILIIETIKKWNEERVSQGEVPLEMGIGIHTGLVVAGNMGAENRLNYTVLGANVNLAARLCEVAKPHQLLISESTLDEPEVANSFFTKELTPIQIKGLEGPVKIFEVLGFKWNV